LTIYYQHIGEAIWARDAPECIGTPSEGLKRFSFSELESFLKELDAFELRSIKSQIAKLAPSGFQIWGIPSGAYHVLEPMETGDFLLLLESSDFAYVGRVIHRVTQHCWELSSHIWGEVRFPLIVFLNGELILYSWDEFREHFGFKANYHMRGNTMRLNPSPSHRLHLEPNRRSSREFSQPRVKHHSIVDMPGTTPKLLNFDAEPP
jgi:hypothetical protein